jgi:LKB1 serine/threonine kinase interacting protein 1
MDPKQITNLAKLLKNNGDKVLNAEYQLSLSGIYSTMNDS